MSPAKAPAAEPGAAGAGVAAGAIIDKLTDPSVNTSLGPQAGLQVTPVSFQSTEQEGRWKPSSLLALPGSAGRIFELKNHTNPGSALKDPYGPIASKNVKLFTVNVPGLSNESTATAVLKAAVEGNVGGVLAAAFTCTFTVDATWWYDGLEIYAGWAGLANATGFGSAFNSTANVALQAIPFGNYYPAAVLITWSGWVNPLGTDYWEFRGGIVVNADGTNSGASSGAAHAVPPQDGATGPPGYMTYWGRDRGQDPKPVEKGWTDKDGFLLKPTSTKAAAQSPQDKSELQSLIEWLSSPSRGLFGPFTSGS